MNPSDLAAAGETLYGPQWRQPMADQLEVDLSTVSRWITGRIKIPGPAALAVQLMLEAWTANRGL